MRIRLVLPDGDIEDLEVKHRPYMWRVPVMLAPQFMDYKNNTEVSPLPLLESIILKVDLEASRSAGLPVYL